MEGRPSNGRGIPFWGFEHHPNLSQDVSGDWDVHWGYGILTHGQLFLCFGAPVAFH